VFEDDVDGGPFGGAAGRSGSVHHRVLKTTPMASFLGALSTGPAASTTEFQCDVYGRPPRGATGGSGSVHH
jgi:hypothetical protein